MPSQDFDKQEFDRAANDKDMWRMRANDLHTSSKVLREKFLDISENNDSEDNLVALIEVLPYAGLPTQAAMLQGFSVEVYLKAFWLHQGNSLALDGIYCFPGKDSHNLVAIAKTVGFDLTDDERITLNLLSLITASYGRYPVTKKWHQNPMKNDEQGISKRLSWDNDDHAIVESIITKLEEMTK